MTMDSMMSLFENSPTQVLGGVRGVATFITIDEQLHRNRGCCFPHASYSDLNFSQINLNHYINSYLI